MKRFEGLEFDTPDPAEQHQTAADPGNRDEHHWLAKADEERRNGLFENALRYYSRALEINKSMVQGWLGQVQMLILLGEYAEAEMWSRKALELFKNNGDLIAGRAQALARMGNLNEALPLSDVSFKQEGQSAYRWMVRGEIMLARQENVDEHCFDKAIQLDASWLTLLEIGQIYRYRRKPAKAIARLRAAVDKAPQSAYCWYVQGVCELELGMFPAARKSLNQCLELRPGYVEASRALDALHADQWSLSGRLKRLFRFK